MDHLVKQYIASSEEKMMKAFQQEIANVEERFQREMDALRAEFRELKEKGQQKDEIIQELLAKNTRLERELLANHQQMEETKEEMQAKYMEQNEKAFREKIDQLGKEFEAKLNQNSEVIRQLLEKNTQLECALNQMKQKDQESAKMIQELLAKNTRLERELLANQRQVEEIKEEMEEKESISKTDKIAKECHELLAKNTHVQSELLERGNQQQVEEIKEEMQTKINSANSQIGALQREFDEEKRKSENERVEMQIICIPGNKWDLCDSRLEVSGMSVTYKTENYGYGTVRAEQPFLWPTQNARRRIEYFEVKILGNPFRLCIGLCDSNCPLSEDLLKCKNSFAIDNYGHIYIDGEFDRKDSGFDKGDVVGCGMDMALASGTAQCCLFFTVNGALTGPPIELPANFQAIALYPAVCMDSGFDEGDVVGNKIEAIFDLNAFKYDLDKHSKEHGLGWMIFT